MKYVLWTGQGLLVLIVLATAASSLSAGGAGAQSDDATPDPVWGVDRDRVRTGERAEDVLRDSGERRRTNSAAPRSLRAPSTCLGRCVQRWPSLGQ